MYLYLHLQIQIQIQAYLYLYLNESEIAYLYLYLIPVFGVFGKYAIKYSPYFYKCYANSQHHKFVGLQVYMSAI